jgi:hypothetical protein
VTVVLIQHQALHPLHQNQQCYQWQWVQPKAEISSLQTCSQKTNQSRLRYRAKLTGTRLILTQRSIQWRWKLSLQFVRRWSTLTMVCRLAQQWIECLISLGGRVFASQLTRIWAIVASRWSCSASLYRVEPKFNSLYVDILAAENSAVLAQWSGHKEWVLKPNAIHRLYRPIHECHKFDY